MYRPACYREDDTETLFAMIRAQPFATLVSANAGEPLATHLPLLLGQDAAGAATLIGHMARGNRHWRALEHDQPLLAVFLGPHAYISPRWYRDEPDVPTWNYAAVHVRGRWRRCDDLESTRRILAASVEHFERAMGADWSLGELEESLVDKLEKGVVAFEIAVDTLEGVSKMSQDKRPADLRGAVEGLRRERGAGQQRQEVARTMDTIEDHRSGVNS